MKKIKRVVKAVGVLGLVGCAVMNSPFAAADDSFWYVGGNIGQSLARIDDARITSQLTGQGLTTSSISHNDSDTAFKLLGGYQFNKHFAIEGGYFDLGQLGYTATTVPAGTLKGNIKIQGVSVDAVGMLPITEKFSAFGRVGVHLAESRDTFSSSGAVAAPTDTTPSKSTVNLKVGLGLQYDFNQSLGMRAEVERYRIDDAVGNTGDVDMYSLGLVYRFGNEKRKPAPVEKVLMPKPEVIVVQAPPPPAEIIVVVAPRKVVFSADSDANALFEFGKSGLKPTGKRALDKFAAELKGADYEVITITGHTDRIGSAAYNKKLSTNRAEAVKDYLVGSAGIPAEKVSAIGAGESQPLTRASECKGTKATPKLVSCLAPDRRVEVDVTGIRPDK